MNRFFLIALLLTLFVPFVSAQVTYHDPQEGTNPKEVTAYQIDPITVDGNFDDWPEGIEKRACAEFYPSYQVNTLGTSTQDNYFMVAWNDEANQLYVAGWSWDDVNVTQLSLWSNPDTLAPAGATWFYDRWEIYIEYDNSDSGAYGLADDPGNVQYTVQLNDPSREDLYGQETDANGEILEGGTATFISNYNDATEDGRPPFSEAKLIIEMEDPASPFGPYVKRFEAALTVMNFLEPGIEPEPETDVVDLGPDMNGGLGMGFDVTMMDRDGELDLEIPDDPLYLTADDEGAWIGWSEGSKNGAPQLDGTMIFSLEFFTPVSISNWALY